VRRRRRGAQGPYVSRIARGMKIAVCIKHVPEGHGRIDPGSKRLDRSGEGALNHFDANAVEEALRLKGDGEGEVVVVSMGPEKAADSLRKALAMGADRAVLVSDAINEPRYPSLKGIMGAKKKPFETLSVSDIGVAVSDAGEAGSKTEVLALGDPPARADARKIEGDGNAAQAILDFLAEKRLV